VGFSCFVDTEQM